MNVSHSSAYRYIDILIAGIAIANDLLIVTNNIRDFEKIENLEIQDWSK